MLTPTSTLCRRWKGQGAMEIRHGGTALTAFGEFTPKWRTAAFDEALLGDIGPQFDAQARPLANPPDEIGVESSAVRNGTWH